MFQKYFCREAGLMAAFLINRMSSRILNFKTSCQTYSYSFPGNYVPFTLPMKVLCYFKLDPKALSNADLLDIQTKKGIDAIKNFCNSIDVFEQQPYYKFEI